MVFQIELCLDLLIFCNMYNNFFENLEEENDIIQFVDGNSFICRFERNQNIQMKIEKNRTNNNSCQRTNSIWMPIKQNLYFANLSYSNRELFLKVKLSNLLMIVVILEYVLMLVDPVSKPVKSQRNL